MFCTECGETVQPGSRFCGSCGLSVGGTGPSPESNEKPTLLKVLFVLWAFAYASVGAGVVLFLVMAFVGDFFGYEEVGLWLAENLLIISAIVGLGNALTRGVAAARRM